MNKQYQQLLEELFSQYGMILSPSEDDIYSIDIDNLFQVIIGLHQDRWIQLFCQLDVLLAQSNNLFGHTWPAHVQGQIDNKSIIWSQQPLEGLNVQEMQSWLTVFIEEIELKRQAHDQQDKAKINITPAAVGMRV